MKSYEVLNVSREVVAKFGVLFFENGAGEVEVTELNGAILVRDNVLQITSDYRFDLAETVRQHFDAWHADARIAVIDA